MGGGGGVLQQGMQGYGRTEAEGREGERERAGEGRPPRNAPRAATAWLPRADPPGRPGVPPGPSPASPRRAVYPTSALCRSWPPPARFPSAALPARFPGNYAFN